MKRLATHMPMPTDVKHVSNFLMDTEGVCTCGLILRRVDPKLFLATGVPSKNRLAVGVYCMRCASALDYRLRALRKVTYTGAETAPVSYDIREIIKV